MECRRQPGPHRHAPPVRLRERLALHGVLVGHQHGQLVTKGEVGGDEGVVVGEGVLDWLDAGCTPPAVQPRTT